MIIEIEHTNTILFDQYGTDCIFESSLLQFYWTKEFCLQKENRLGFHLWFSEWERNCTRPILWQSAFFSYYKCYSKISCDIFSHPLSSLKNELISTFQSTFLSRIEFLVRWISRYDIWLRNSDIPYLVIFSHFRLCSQRWITNDTPSSVYKNQGWKT